jgi:hypothetical protein
MASKSSKPVPPRSRKIAEEYAKKVRMEPPKASRQDPGLEVAPSEGTPGAHDHGPPQKPRNKKFPEGGKKRPN